MACVRKFSLSCACRAPVELHVLRPFAFVERPSGADIDCRSLVAVAVPPCDLI